MAYLSQIKLNDTTYDISAIKLKNARTISLTGSVTGSGSFDGSGNLSIATTTNHSHSYLPLSGGTLTGNLTINVNAARTIYNNGTASMWCGVNTDGNSWGLYNITEEKYIIRLNDGKVKSSYPIYGAVWNDYAEFRESNCKEFGYVLMEVGDDSLTKTIERLSHFAGVSSDTWGFSQGETDKAKTPIAVAGRVLVYPYQDRNNYKPGDCVCAAPGGTVDIMTREEVKEWPDRIVGTVSCVPDYEEWGGGEGADRDPVKVNGRIWIKVK